MSGSTKRRPMTPNDPRHGTYGGHVAGCRQECCKAAKRAYQADLKARHADGEVDGRKIRIPGYYETPAPGTWDREAACRSEIQPVDLWTQDHPTKETVARAKAICRTCPVLAECDAHHALHGGIGIVAGRTEKERRQKESAA